MHKSIFARPLAAIAAAMAIIVVAASMLAPTSAQAGRRDGVIDPHIDLWVEQNGLVLSECYDGLVLSECFDNLD